MYSIFASQIQTSYSVPYIGSFYRALASGNSMLAMDVFISEPLTVENFSAFAPVAQFTTNASSAQFAINYEAAKKALDRGDMHNVQVEQLFMGVAIAHLKEKESRNIAAAVHAMFRACRCSIFHGIDAEMGSVIFDALERRVEKEEQEIKRCSVNARTCSDGELLWSLKRHLGTEIRYVENELGFLRNPIHSFIRRAGEKNPAIVKAMELWALAAGDSRIICVSHCRPPRIQSRDI